MNLLPQEDLGGASLAGVAERLARCRRCERLVAWREQVAVERRAAFRDQQYWGRPLAGFGDPAARVLIFGLAPAAHGANRTGRMFTGDRSGDFLFAALWRCGFASAPQSISADDGLRLDAAFVTAAVRCAPPGNRPSTQERDSCESWTIAETALLPELRVVLCLGGFAWQQAIRLRRKQSSAPPGAQRVAAQRFGHAAELPPAVPPLATRAGDRARGPRAAADSALAAGPFAACTLLGAYHPSQQNTFTGRLRPEMLDAVLLRARTLAGLPPAPPASTPVER